MCVLQEFTRTPRIHVLLEIANIAHTPSQIKRGGEGEMKYPTPYTKKKEKKSTLCVVRGVRCASRSCHTTHTIPCHWRAPPACVNARACLFVRELVRLYPCVCVCARVECVRVWLLPAVPSCRGTVSTQCSLGPLPGSQGHSHYRSAWQGASGIFLRGTFCTARSSLLRFFCFLVLIFFFVCLFGLWILYILVIL